MSRQKYGKHSGQFMYTEQEEDDNNLIWRNGFVYGQLSESQLNVCVFVSDEHVLSSWQNDAPPCAINIYRFPGWCETETGLSFLVGYFSNSHQHWLSSGFEIKSWKGKNIFFLFNAFLANFPVDGICCSRSNPQEFLHLVDSVPPPKKSNLSST